MLTFEVAEPPADQQHEQRLSLVFFNGSTGDMRLRPFTGEYIFLLLQEQLLTFGSPESPLLQREGFIEHQGVFMQFKKLMDAGIPVLGSYSRLEVPC